MRRFDVYKFYVFELILIIKFIDDKTQTAIKINFYFDQAKVIDSLVIHLLLGLKIIANVKT